MEEYSIIGKSIPRIDAIPKVIGEAKYAMDIYLPGMLHGKLFKSIHPHAKILRIHTEKAKKLPGVKTVVTAEDVPDIKYGSLVMDRGIFAREKVRYIGEPIGAVVAVDEDTALAALDLITVEYEELPAVFDPLEAMLPEAPILHEDLKKYITCFPVTEWSMSGNVSYHSAIHQGDIEAGFARSDFFFEDIFKTSKVHNANLEPQTCIAVFDSDGRVTVWSSTQRPHTNQSQICNLLELPASKVRVIGDYLGGGSGEKTRSFFEPLCVALAQKAKAPVRLSLTREEIFTCTTTRYPAIIQIKTGVKKNGTLVAFQMYLIYDAGAYAPTPNAVWLGAVTGAGPYRIPNVNVEAFCVYTNNPISGAFRGYGVPQVTFARESHMDRIANELKIDPVEIRLKNCFQKGDSLPIGQKLHCVNIEDTIRQSAERMEWQRTRKSKNRALGISCCFNPCGGFATSSIVRINMDGTVIVSTGGIDMGQGLKTVVAQIVAEELSVDVKDITVISGDTDSTPYDVGIWGDRGTHTTALATQMAAIDAKNKLLDMVAEQMEANREELYMADWKVFVRSVPEPLLSLRDIYNKRKVYKRGFSDIAGSPVIGVASINPQTPPVDPRIVQGAASRFNSTYTFATNIVEVELDPDTGQINVIKAIGVHDCGTVINPIGVEGQIEGGMVIGQGYGLLEEMHIKNGLVLNPNFIDYSIPTALDVPVLITGTVKSYDERGPFGAKGVGNPSTTNMAPAIANAIFALTGVQVKELPITPEKVLTTAEGASKKGVSLESFFNSIGNAKKFRTK
jgi:CO/xanthine dehydrogenase Mo-binding subunit